MILAVIALLPSLANLPPGDTVDYVFEPPAASTFQGVGSVPQPGSSLAGPPMVSEPPSRAAAPPSLPTVSVPGSSLQPGFGLPVAIVPTPPQVARHR